MTKKDFPVMGDGPGMFKMIHDTAPCVDEDVPPDDSGEWSIVVGDSFTSAGPGQFWVRNPARWVWVPDERNTQGADPICFSTKRQLDSGEI